MKGVCHWANFLFSTSSMSISLLAKILKKVAIKSYPAALLPLFNRKISMASLEDKRVELEKFLKDNSLDFTTIEHPAVYTVDEMMPFVKDVEGAICKNLFLKDKKKNLYLLSAVHDAAVKLNDVAKSAGAPGGLRLADESLLTEYLGVTQGSVTALSLHVDTECKVRFLCDKRLLDGTYTAVNFHPMVNTATTTLSSEAFSKYLTACKHEPTLVNFT